MNFIVYVFFGLLGLVIGSFLNVVVLRLHTKKISKGRSKCIHCNHVLSLFDLVPILSYLFLMGRCQYCKVKISKQYIFVESLTAIIFILLACKIFGDFGYANMFDLLQFVTYSFIFSLLIVLSVYDSRHFILPWKIMRIFLVSSFILPLIFAFIGDGITMTNFVAGFITALPFWALWYFSQGRLIGFGDVQLMCGFGFLLGISQGFTAIMLGFWAGALFIFLKMIFSRKILDGKTQIPFGPFLAIGAFLAFIFDYNLSIFMNIFLN